MKNPLATLIELVSPYILAAIAVYLILTEKLLNIEVFSFNLGIVSISSIVEDRVVKTGAVLAVMAIPPIIQFSRDYSTFFPHTLEFNLFFDYKGIVQTLERDFGAGDVEKLSIAPDWQQKRREYLVKFNETLRSQEGLEHLTIDNTTTGDGDFHFKFHKCSRLEQTYQMDKGSGQVRVWFDREVAGQHIVIHYELMKTEHDYIKATFKDLFVTFTKIIRPTFSQYVYLGPRNRLPIVNFISFTKLKFFPWSDIGNTLYCVEHTSHLEEEDGYVPEYVPIAYAVYDLK